VVQMILLIFLTGINRSLKHIENSRRDVSYYGHSLDTTWCRAG